MSSLDAKLGRRRTVNMSEEIAQELNRIANLRGKTLYSLINEIGSQAIAAEKQGFSLGEAARAKRLIESAKKSRKVLVNQDLWYFASSQAMKNSKGRWLRLVADSSRWDANVFLRGSEPSGAPEFLESLRRLVEDFLWDCSEISLVVEEGRSQQLLLKAAFVPEMPLEHTQALFKMFEGMLNVSGFIATDSSVGAGFLSAAFKRIASSVAPKA